MSKHYAAPEEILYHVGFSAQQLQGATVAVLPGDPGRVEPLAKALGSDASFIASHREYTSWLTKISDTPVLVCSTGMGGPSVAICLEELARMGIKKLIRFGTTGTIQEKVNLGDIIIDKAAVRLDGTSQHYAPLEFPAVASFEVTTALVLAAKNAGAPYHLGIAASSDTFWPGQERYDSFSGYVRTSYQGLLSDFQAMGCTNFEMENATLFTLASVMGLRAGSVCGVVAKRTESESIAPQEVYALAEERFQKTVKRALEMLIGHFMVTL